MATKQAIDAGTIVHMATFSFGALSPNWSEKCIVERVTAKHRAPVGQFDAIADGFVPVRFADGGRIMCHRDRLMIANDQSRKARAAFRMVRAA